MKGSGIYIIRNTVTEKVYVGSSTDIERRWAEHRRMLESGNHHSPKLQKAWSEYSSEAFEFLVVEEVVDHKLLRRREQFLLDQYKSWTEKGYNILQFAGFRRPTKTTTAIELTQLNFRVNPRFKEALQKWCELEGVSQTHVINDFLRDIERKVKKAEQANPSP